MEHYKGRTVSGRYLLGINPAAKPLTNLNCTPLAIENFPRDHFTQKQRRSGAVIIHILASAYMFLALAIVCDEYFIPCLEIISQVLRLQPDVAGATFMAAGSSAPELATTLVGVFIARDDIGLGAVVGSADYNVMFVISVCALFSKEVIYLNWWPLVRDCSFYLLSIILLAAVIADEKVYWYEALIFLVFYAVYILIMRFNPILDRRSNAWCLAHPNFCPRVLHSQAESIEYAGQSSGKFGGKQLFSNVGDDGLHEGLGLNGTDATLTNYSRLEEEAGHFVHAVPDVPDTKATRDDFAVVPPVTEGSKVVIDGEGKDARTWSQIIFGPLALPPRGTGVCKWTYFILAWPIRFCLCLTTPDCRVAKWRRFQGHWITFFMSCVWIGIFTLIMMWMISVVGLTFGIPDTIMGLTFIAAGSSVPDAIASVIVVREGEGDMAVANAVGSNIFDILVCMGLPWILRCAISRGPVIIYSEGMTYAALTLFSTVLILLAATHINRWRLTKKYGVCLMVAYVAFLILCSLYELNIFGMVHPPECPYAGGN
ncbi:unnamed protein product [Schistocephalus solidus]|uniref:Sodium/potassium/calcium exchanger 3 n=1 Tax=Schistocephalus solidus TaxID=70667 RepID=A0A183SUK5_SCHSO|nr:unnamed protein product [Schistocephalus solidus]